MNTGVGGGDVAVVCIDGTQRTQCSSWMARSGFTPSVEPICSCSLLSESATLHRSASQKRGTRLLSESATLLGSVEVQEGEREESGRKTLGFRI